MEKIKNSFMLVDKYVEGDVLDLGCGRGFFSKHLKNKGHDVLGIDLNKEYLDYAKNIHKIDCINMNVMNLKLDKKYDTILLFGIIGFLPTDLVDFLNNLQKHLSDEGTILIQTANSSSLIRRLRVLFGMIPTEPLIHYEFTRQSLKNLIHQTDYKLITMTSNKRFALRHKVYYMPFDSFAHEIFMVLKKV